MTKQTGFHELLKAPPKSCTKAKRYKGPFSGSLECCLSANQWRQLREWIDGYYFQEHLDELTLPLSVCDLTRLVRGEPFGNMIDPLFLMELPKLSFRRKLDEAAIRESLKGLAYLDDWSIDDNDKVIRGGQRNANTANV